MPSPVEIDLSDPWADSERIIAAMLFPLDRVLRESMLVTGAAFLLGLRGPGEAEQHVRAVFRQVAREDARLLRIDRRILEAWIARFANVNRRAAERAAQEATAAFNYAVVARAPPLDFFEQEVREQFAGAPRNAASSWPA